MTRDRHNGGYGGVRGRRLLRSLRSAQIALTMIGVASFGAAVAGCSQLFPASYRYRMTVDAVTSKGPVTGSAVYQITAYKNYLKMTAEEAAGGGSFRGQAIRLDVPGGPVFVMMELPRHTRSLDGQVTAALLPGVRLGGPDYYIPAVRRLGSSWFGYKADLPRADWPLMLRFRDFNDPASVEAVDPSQVRVVQVRVETTRGAISKGVERSFPPWFGKLLRARARLNGKTSVSVFSSDLADNLMPGDFSTELSRD